MIGSVNKCSRARSYVLDVVVTVENKIGKDPCPYRAFFLVGETNNKLKKLNHLAC